MGGSVVGEHARSGLWHDLSSRLYRHYSRQGFVHCYPNQQNNHGGLVRMFTVKVYTDDRQTDLYQCEEIRISKGERELIMKGPGTKAVTMGLTGAETVYVENDFGKTVHLIRGVPRQDA